MKTFHLKGKHCIRDLSYKPEEVRHMDEAGLPIIDIVTSGSESAVIMSWVAFFKSKDVPTFAARSGHGSDKVVLWIEQTVESEHDQRKKYVADSAS